MLVQRTVSDWNVVDSTVFKICKYQGKCHNNDNNDNNNKNNAITQIVL